MNEPPSQSGRSRRQARRIGLVGILLLTGIAILGWSSRGPAIPAGIPPERYRAAEAAFRRHYNREPDPLDSLSWLGEAAVRQGDDSLAAAAFAAIPTEDSRYGASARLQQGQILLKLNRAVAARDQLEQFLAAETIRLLRPPEETMVARRHLIYIAGILLHFSQRQELLRQIVSASAEPTDLLVFCFPTLHRWNGAEATERMQAFLDQDQENPELLAASAFYRAAQGSLDEAERLARDAMQRSNDSVPARTSLLAVLCDAGRWQEADELLAGMTASEASEPWFLTRRRGQTALHFQRYDTARAAFLLGLQQDETSVECWQGLAKVAAASEDRELKEEAQRRVAALSRIQSRLGWARQSPRDVEPYIEIAALCREGGFDEVAIRIARYAKRFAGSQPAALEKLNQIERDPPPVGETSLP
jgi:tetratricopeptide (TPR) repeat protein